MRGRGRLLIQVNFVKAVSVLGRPRRARADRNHEGADRAAANAGDGAMRSILTRAALVAALMLATGLPVAPDAAAAGIIDPALPDLVAKLLPSCVNITTTRY